MIMIEHPTPLKELLAGWEDRNGSGDCSQWIHSSGTNGVWNRGACYSDFSRYGEEKRQFLYIGVMSRFNSEGWTEVAKDHVGGYLRWMKWIMVDSAHAEAIVPDQAIKYPMMVEMNVDANHFLVHHTANVLRIHQEHIRIVPVWILLTEAGMEEDLAYLLAITLYMADGVICASSQQTHAAMSSGCKNNLKGFLLREVCKGGVKSWKEYSKYSGHGTLWCKSHDEDSPIDLAKLCPKSFSTNKASKSRYSIASLSFNMDPKSLKAFVKEASETIPRHLGVQRKKSSEGGARYEKI